MERIDLTQEEMEEVVIKGRLALFTGLRPDKKSIPDGVYCYALRHGDDGGMPCSIEKSVAVNYFGTVVTTEPFDFGDKDYIPVKYDDFGFTGERLSIEQFVEKINKLETETVFEYQGLHYMPVRRFNQEERNMSMPEISVYLRDVKGTRVGMMPYDYNEFYAASGDSNADIFQCVETGKQYIPCGNMLQEYTKEIQEEKSKMR